MISTAPTPLQRMQLIARDEEPPEIEHIYPGGDRPVHTRQHVPGEDCWCRPYVKFLPHRDTIVIAHRERN